MALKKDIDQSGTFHRLKPEENYNFKQLTHHIKVDLGLSPKCSDKNDRRIYDYLQNLSLPKQGDTFELVAGRPTLNFRGETLTSAHMGCTIDLPQGCTSPLLRKSLYAVLLFLLKDLEDFVAEKARLPWPTEWEWMGEKAIVAVTNPLVFRRIVLKEHPLWHAVCQLLGLYPEFWIPGLFEYATGQPLFKEVV